MKRLSELVPPGNRPTVLIDDWGGIWIALDPVTATREPACPECGNCTLQCFRYVDSRESVLSRAAYGKEDETIERCIGCIGNWEDRTKR
jgi:hypothetical protein